MIQTISADDLFRFLTDKLAYKPEIVRPRDARYVIWPREFILGQFAKAFEQFKKDIGADEYVSEENDCEDSSDLAVIYAKLTHRRSPGRPPNSSPAFGTFDYARIGLHNVSRHCANCALVSEPELSLLWFEPQWSQEAILTEDERRICYEIRF
jgi:hypothetical protein